MNLDTWLLVFAIIAVGFGLTALILIIDLIRSRDTKEWRIDIRAIQLENSRYLKKVHDENTRFFKSMGLTMQQIFERVDGGRHYDPEGP